MPARKVRANRKLHPIEKVDLTVGRAVALEPRGWPGKAAGKIAEMGDQPPLLALSGAVVALGLVRRDERLARTGLRMLAAHSIGIIGKLVGKNLVDRTRPGAAIDRRNYKLKPGTSRQGRLRSMPSGHSTGTVAVALAGAVDHPAARLPIAAAASTVTGAQIPSRNHFLSDVIVGAAIGLAAAAIARALVPPLDQVEQ